MGKDFNESVDVLFHKVEDLVSTKTVVGEAIELDGLTLLPLTSGTFPKVFFPHYSSMMVSSSNFTDSFGSSAADRRKRTDDRRRLQGGA
mgnify:CR=1 FL=1